MPAKTRRWCSKHADMGPHIGARCLTCDPEGPKPIVEALLAEPLEIAFVKPKAIDVIRAAGERGATVGEIKAAGADPAELFTDLHNLEIGREITTRSWATRDGLAIWFYVEKREAA